jgi:hypothetical protein
MLLSRYNTASLRGAASMLLVKSIEKTHVAFRKWMKSRDVKDKVEIDEAGKEADGSAEIEEVAV